MKGYIFEVEFIFPFQGEEVSEWGQEMAYAKNLKQAKYKIFIFWKACILSDRNDVIRIKAKGNHMTAYFKDGTKEVRWLRKYKIYSLNEREE